MPTINLSLSDAVHKGLEADARASNLKASDQAMRIIEDHLAAKGLLEPDVKAEITLSRSLVDRAIEEALAIKEREGFRSSITYDAIQAVSGKPDWLKDYEKLVGDNPFKAGNPRKQTINQNLGYFIKKALGADSLLNANGRPANVKVVPVHHSELHAAHHVSS